VALSNFCTRAYWLDSKRPLPSDFTFQQPANPAPTRKIFQSPTTTPHLPFRQPRLRLSKADDSCLSLINSNVCGPSSALIATFLPVCNRDTTHRVSYRSLAICAPWCEFLLSTSYTDTSPIGKMSFGGGFGGFGQNNNTQQSAFGGGGGFGANNTPPTSGMCSISLFF